MNIQKGVQPFYCGLILFSYVGLIPKWLLICFDQPCSTRQVPAFRQTATAFPPISHTSDWNSECLPDCLPSPGPNWSNPWLSRQYQEGESIFTYMLFNKSLTLLEEIVNRMKPIYFQKLLNSSITLTPTCSLNWTHSSLLLDSSSHCCLRPQLLPLSLPLEEKERRQQGIHIPLGLCLVKNRTAI